ncbi:hypothetical protein HA466_0160880 [Hirschfeldia incana]|nr:hypothetical protein HA466_0160880 [Hirschfeldia incana]
MAVRSASSISPDEALPTVVYPSHERSSLPMVFVSLSHDSSHNGCISDEALLSVDCITDGAPPMKLVKLRRLSLLIEKALSFIKIRFCFAAKVERKLEVWILEIFQRVSFSS